MSPSTPLQGDGREKFLGDGSMRQVTPLSPALHLGASRILWVGVGQPERPGLGLAVEPEMAPAKGPTLGSMAGHVIASVFHDTLQADVEQTQRVTQTITGLPSDAVQAMRFKAIDVLAGAPSQSLDARAREFTGVLPPAILHATGALGVRQGAG